MEKKKILIVDDEPAFVEAFRVTFEAKGYEVLTASSRIEAQEAVRRHSPQLVVLGTLYPRGEAFMFHTWLKKDPHFRHIPLIVIDAPPEQRGMRGWLSIEGMQLEAEDYLIKPVEPSAIYPLVRNSLERRPDKVRILVVDDHTMVRDGICAVLRLQEDMEVVGEATNGREAVEKTLRLMPTVVLMDIVMPVMNGLEATKEILKLRPESKILILTQYDEEENLLVARQAGAHGFIPKRAASSALLEGIRAVGKGQYYPPSFGEGRGGQALRGSFL
mgnify:CR=1 FL=1